MSATMLDPTTSLDAIAELFRAAMMDAEVRDDDRLLVEDPVLGLATIWLDERNDLLHMSSWWTIKEEASGEQRLAFANRINDNYILIRASIAEDGDLFVDDYLPLAGGLPARTVVQIVRRFLDVMRLAVRQQDTEDIVG